MAWLALLGLQSVAVSAGCGGEALPALQCADGEPWRSEGVIGEDTPDEELSERWWCGGIMSCDAVQRRIKK